MFRYLFILLLLIPVLEIYVLIKVGSIIGAGWTIFLVIATAVIGAGLLRREGFSTLERAQTAMARGEIPAVAMLEGVALVFSGAFLLTPGFITDTIGFLLLIPPLRRVLIKQLLRNSKVVFRNQHYNYQQNYRAGDVIEGEVIDKDDPHHLH